MTNDDREPVSPEPVANEAAEIIKRLQKTSDVDHDISTPILERVWHCRDD